MADNEKQKEQAIVRAGNRGLTTRSASLVKRGLAQSSILLPTIGTVWTNSIAMELVYLPPGEFMMGSDDTHADEKPVHKVTISSGFWIGKYPVTQGQWQSVMGTTIQQQRNKADLALPPCGEGGDYPMYYISWEEANEFICRLNKRNDGFQYGLPSEAQWEYAARADTIGDHYGTIDDIAWYKNNSGVTYFDNDSIWDNDRDNYFKLMAERGGQAHPVGLKSPNKMGLYDMIGNVNEWCEDIYNKDGYEGLPTDGSANLNVGGAHERVLRGGSWDQFAIMSRSTYRTRVESSYRYNDIGFRVVARPSVGADFEKNTYDKLRSHFETAYEKFADEPDEAAQTNAFVRKLHERFSLEQIEKLKPFVVAFLEEKGSRKR